MLRATVNTVRRGSSSTRAADKPGWFQSWLVPQLQSITRATCTHPIHTITIIGVLASTAYIALLESSLFEPPTRVDLPVGHTDIATFLGGSKTLHAGTDTEWKWQNSDFLQPSVGDTTSSHNALLTLVFPEYNSDTGAQSEIPKQHIIASFANASSELLPSSKSLLSPISSESTLAYSVPYNAAGDFLASLRELPTRKAFKGTQELEEATENGEPKWIMTAMRSPADGAQRSFKRRVQDAWTAFTDVLKNAEELDIVIMVLGYLSMHLTFVSLFMSLRKLGSNLWLGITTLLSSVFALLFALIVTIQLGVPLNMVLLSEGLPFLVVTIGFEKPIVLTKAVLSASFALKRSSGGGRNQANGMHDRGRASSSSPHIQSAIQIAVKEKGYEIVKDYAIEILILIAGAASGVQGGLCQFCFLAAWILFFDCILLFTFYTAILTVKLEVNRIKRHVALRRALEETGVDRQNAEKAANEEWPNADDMDHVEASSRSAERAVFGMKARDSSVSRFKVLMVFGFIAINVLNFCTIPFRSSARSAGSALSSAVTQPPMDPFKVAGSGLDVLLTAAKRNRVPTAVTVLTPIKYELSDGLLDDVGDSMFDMDRLFDRMGGKMVESMLKSFEDPLLSKWIIIALVISLFLNGYLFNAARWTIKETAQHVTQNESGSEAANGHSIAPRRREPELREAVHQQNGAPPEANNSARDEAAPQRTRDECVALLRQDRAPELNDDELIDLSLARYIPLHGLEKKLKSTLRAVKVRRAVVSRTPATTDVTQRLEQSLLPFKDYDYDRVLGSCCENVVGYLPLPLGVAGPLTIDGKSYFIPMATTEGVLVASTSRGAKVINAGGGAITAVTGDGMTRGPCVGFNTLTRASEAKLWLDSEEGQRVIREAFNSTSRFARLQTLKTALAGTYLYIRFKTTTGDAMGMNMISKGVEKALHVMSTEHGFDDMAIITVSGNYCTDKKPAAINWVDGRGKSVVAEAIIPAEVVKNDLHSDVDALVELNMSKNLIGSAMAGSIGGFNAHAANIVAATFLATGQDPAQVVESSQCITVMKKYKGNLQISVSLPCVEVGTLGGGTLLGPQSSMLDLLGVHGSDDANPGANARQLARIIAAAVLAGELSLCSALAAGHLVRAHMQHNRAAAPPAN
ncbi:MAG: hypothetical protein Q9162_003800 [Coniocarpon cinnabarinum]